MKKYLLALLLTASISSALPAAAAPRDAEAVLNRCGKPLKGDDIVLDNSPSGGHRILKYERGFLYFDRLANDGWTFRYGMHKKQTNLEAEEMSKFMPCLKDGLADSASAAPIRKMTSLGRVEVSMKRAYKTVVLSTFLFLILLGGVFYLLSRRTPNTDGLVG